MNNIRIVVIAILAITAMASTTPDHHWDTKQLTCIVTTMQLPYGDGGVIIKATGASKPMWLYPIYMSMAGKIEFGELVPVPDSIIPPEARLLGCTTVLAEGSRGSDLPMPYVTTGSEARVRRITLATLHDLGVLKGK